MPEEEEEAVLLRREEGAGRTTREGGREAQPPLPLPLARSKGEDVGRVGGREKVRKGRLCGVGRVERND